MKRHGENAAFTASLLLVVAGFAIASLRLTPIGRLVPIWVAGPTLLLLIAQLWVDVSGSAAPAAGEMRAPRRGPSTGGRRAGHALALTSLLFVLVALVGIPLASALYVGSFVRRECGARWPVWLPLALATTLLTYGAIVLVLGKRLLSGSVW